MPDAEVQFTYTAAEVRVAEQALLANGDEARLMGLAADAVAAEVRTMRDGRFGTKGGATIVILAGTGKNGGDALLAGARLARGGEKVTAVLTGTSCHHAAMTEYLDAGGAIVTPDAIDMGKADLVIDGIVGLGATAGLRESAASLVAAISARTPVLSVDLPSGLSSDSGDAGLPHVPATVTVTFTALKPCLVLPPAATAAGRVVVADLGIDLPPPPPESVRRMTLSGVSARWPVPTPADNKFSRGVVGVIAGSDAYPGAAVLTTSSAVRAGAGLVHYVGPLRAQNLVLAARPEVVVSQAPVGDDLPRVDAWVLGPGVADDASQNDAINAALASGIPCVVDAGAILACVTRRAAGTQETPAEKVLLTPHAGELARALAALGLASDPAGIAQNPAHHALALASATDTTVLLKGAVTLIVRPDGTLWSQADGPAWLATAGAGDVLAGIAGMLLAAGLPADEAGAMAALVHGRAATLASGGGPISALDIAEFLQATIGAISPEIARILTSPIAK